ncbi:acyl-CoA dehydrogenase family protein [Nesterenkonia ebinurensis]|uniref:acyl-CoA dehydrogenase family protein n=1 Tax=Nesterenkonia ebinurensis TaxID=2608252 RepID=UPI00123CEDAD|nr:acyl-CoA dehydrogenase family protein [Nesterenkonia ebinurensis]
MPLTQQSPRAAATTPPATAVTFLDLARHLEPAECERLERIDQQLQATLRPASIEPWNQEEFPQKLLPGLGALGLGETFADGSSHLFQGLASAAVARADISISALLGIHNELILGTIATLGSAEQKQTWLPRLRSLESLGAFCLTEPEHGSDIAGGLATTARRTAQGWHIAGAKRWIGVGTIADIAIVWARDTADQQIKGFLVPTDAPGYSAQKISNKTGLRIMQNADVQLDVTIPANAQLPGASSFSATNELLMSSRAWVGWQAVGAQQALLDVMSAYAGQREQFGRPIDSFQLIQAKLAEVAGNLTASAAMMADTADLQARGELTMMRASMAKATLTRLARSSAAIARESLGGNGLVSDFEAAKIAGDVEAIYTYEGSYHINSLIVGRALTGVSAFI